LFRGLASRERKESSKIGKGRRIKRQPSQTCRRQDEEGEYAASSSIKRKKKGDGLFLLNTSKREGPAKANLNPQKKDFRCLPVLLSYEKTEVPRSRPGKERQGGAGGAKGE